MTVRIGFLGGLGEIGRNCAAIEIDGTFGLIDCGLMFPEEDMLGVDLVLPDLSLVLDDQGRCRVRDLSPTGTRITSARWRTSSRGERPRLRHQLPSSSPGRASKIRRQLPTCGPSTHTSGSTRTVRFTFVPVSHSIPQAAGVAFDTPEGIVVHSGDFKLDPTPIDGDPTDLATFARSGTRGVGLLWRTRRMPSVTGFVPSEVDRRGARSTRSSPMPRAVIVACFASHVHRVQQAIDAVVGTGASSHSSVGRCCATRDIAASSACSTSPTGPCRLNELVDMPTPNADHLHG